MADTKANRAYPSIPEITGDPASHTAALRAIKEAIEIHERRTKEYLDSFVRLRELVELDLVKVRGRQLLLGDGVSSDAGGAGVSDHGELTGLTDNDHTQYVLRSILTTNGDIFTRLAGAVARLAVGTEGQVLTVSSGLPSWQPSTSGVTDHGALTGLADDDHTQYVLRSILTTNGDLFTRAAGAIGRIAIGTEGQVLSVASGAPAWADAASSSGWELAVSDTFTDTNGVDIDAHTPDVDLEGGGWTEYVVGGGTPTANQAEIQSNALQLSVGSQGGVIEVNSMDVFVEYNWTLGAGDNRSAAVLRYVDDSNAIQLSLREVEGDIRIRKIVAGTTTTIKTASFAFADSTTYNMKIAFIGDWIRVWVDDVVIIQASASDDDALDSIIGTKVGVQAATSTVAQVVDTLTIYRRVYP